MPTITRDELRDILLGKRGCHIVTLITYTRPEMDAWHGERPTKKNPHANGVRNPYHGHTWKRAKVNGPIGFWYENAINIRREWEGKEPDFVALDHRYHEHIPGCPVTHHRDDPTRLYLPILDPRSHGYQYEVDGEVVPNHLIDPWLRRKEEGTRQGLDTPRRYREYKIESITDLHAFGDWFAVEHPDAVRAG